MKKIIYSLLFISIAVVGCKSDSKTAENLVGKWNITDVDIQLKEMPEGMEGMMEMMKTAILKSSYEFKSDGTFMNNAMGQDITGTWTYDGAKNAIVLKGDNAKQDSEDNILQIKTGDANKMVLTNEKKDEGSITLTLEKAKPEEKKAE